MALILSLMSRILCSALLIDMDGVLVDSTAAIARVWARWTARHNMDAEAITALAHGRTSLAAIREILPDARALLASAPPAQRAIVTSASRPLAEVRFRAAGLWDLVGQIVTASDIQHAKPHPEPYLKGAASLNLPPKGCVVIEDAASGTRAGKAAGARVLAIRTTSEDTALLAAGADWIANDCASLTCSVSPHTRLLVLQFPEREIPRLPKMR